MLSLRMTTLKVNEPVPNVAFNLRILLGSCSCWSAEDVGGSPVRVQDVVVPQHAAYVVEERSAMRGINDIPERVRRGGRRGTSAPPSRCLALGLVKAVHT